MGKEKITDGLKTLSTSTIIGIGFLGLIEGGIRLIHLLDKEAPLINYYLKNEPLSAIVTFIVGIGLASKLILAGRCVE